ncbi:MAG: hypothetical protein R2819_03460 [Allomuricauda sp.]
MSRNLNTLLLLLVGYSSISQLDPLSVADLNFKIPIASYYELTYGFEAGDRIIIDFEEEKGKGVNQFEVLEYPSNARFTAFKVKEVKNKIIAVAKKGIYVFRFTNTSLGNRICRLKLKRIPASEEKIQFNTNVGLRTVADTTYTTSFENYIIRDEYVAKQIVAKNSYYLNGGSNSTFKDGKSRVVLPINLPPNTIKWYYTISASRDESETNEVVAGLDLLGDLTNLIDHTGAVDFAMDQLTQPPGSDYCDVYLIDSENYGPFLNKQSFNHFQNGTRENIKSGVVGINTGEFPNQIYLGLKNPTTFYGVNIAIEVVAIVQELEIGRREIKIPHVTYREELYLEE